MSRLAGSDRNLRMVGPAPVPGWPCGQVHDWDLGGSELVGRAEAELYAVMDR